MVTFFLIVFIFTVAATLYVIGKETGCNSADKKVGQLEAEYRQCQVTLNEVRRDWETEVKYVRSLDCELRKVKGQKKSSEVRTGLIAEQMAPFLEGFPYAPKSAVFLGAPLDFVVFDEAGVHFVEVKSGNAQLSTKQRKIRDQMKNNKVTFEVYRVKGE